MPFPNKSLRLLGIVSLVSMIMITTGCGRNGSSAFLPTMSQPHGTASAPQIKPLDTVWRCDGLTDCLLNGYGADTIADLFTTPTVSMGLFGGGDGGTEVRCIHACLGDSGDGQGCLDVTDPSCLIEIKLTIAYPCLNDPFAHGDGWGCSTDPECVALYRSDWQNASRDLAAALKISADEATGIGVFLGLPWGSEFISGITGIAIGDLQIAGVISAIGGYSVSEAMQMPLTEALSRFGAAENRASQEYQKGCTHYPYLTGASSIGRKSEP